MQNMRHRTTRLHLPKLAEKGLSLGRVSKCLYLRVRWSSVILNCHSYLLDLEARIKAYESEREACSVSAGSVTAALEVLDAENAISEPSDSLQLPILSLNAEKEDIDENPLIEETTHLVLSPEGGERRKKCNANIRIVLMDN